MPRINDGIPELWDVPRMQKNKMIRQYASGARYARDVVPDVADLEAGPVINRTAVSDWMAGALKVNKNQPVYYLDFETVYAPCPRLESFVGSNNRIPLQYSLHVDTRGWTALDKDIEDLLMRSCVSGDGMKGLPKGVGHKEFLTTKPDSDDEREELVKRLIADTVVKGPIVVWNAAFERSVLKDLQKVFPQHSTELQDIIDRLTDLADPFSKGLYRSLPTYSSSSLKVVLPALCQTLTYPPSTIGNGAQATLFMYKMFKGMLPYEAVQRRVPELLTYCRVDTAAMLAIASALKRMVGKNGAKALL
eukprot:TRINITY_DN2621_c1_g1_i10.p2 TRINITY_DN2621_c1_g1~~TRINITY_DN2621_c1_g1_i10.p2  ORF type:complete len:305 (+),score=62.80 TRINITY_DN2621_c1_g1_i10:423-1337(+)